MEAAGVELMTFWLRVNHAYHKTFFADASWLDIFKFRILDIWLRKTVVDE